MLNFFTLKGEKENISPPCLCCTSLFLSLSVSLVCCFFPSLHPPAHRKFELVWINPDITNSGFWDMKLFIVIVWFTEIKFNRH